MNTYIERALAEAITLVWRARPDDPLDIPVWTAAILATEPMQAIANVVEAAVVLERFMRSDTEDWTPGLHAVGDFYAAVAALEEAS